MPTTSSLFAAVTLRSKLFIAAAAIALLPAMAWSQEYTVTNLGNFGGGNSIPTAVNNLGQVAGYSTYPTSGAGFQRTMPFFYSNGVLNSIYSTDQDDWPGSNYALALNDAGEVVGEYFSQSTEEVNAFENVEPNGAWMHLAPNNQSAAVAVNQFGTAVGINGYSQSPPYGANFLTGGFAIGVVFSDNQVLDIPTGGYTGFNPTGINNANQISGSCIDRVGYYFGCIFTNGAPQEVQPAPAFLGTIWAYTAAINASGYMCGESYVGTNMNPTYTAATYWKDSNGYQLGAPPNAFNSQCFGMDDYEAGVGDATTISNGQIGVLYDPIDGAQDLNTLVSQDFPKGASFRIVNAVSMSNTGFIAAQCRYEDGSNNACLLTPNPVMLIRNSILTLTKKTKIECRSCKDELESEAKALPKSLVELSANKRDKVATSMKKIEGQLTGLVRDGEVTPSAAMVLMHQMDLVLAAIKSKG